MIYKKEIMFKRKMKIYFFTGIKVMSHTFCTRSQLKKIQYTYENIYVIYIYDYEQAKNKRLLIIKLMHFQFLGIDPLN